MMKSGRTVSRAIKGNLCTVGRLSRASNFKWEMAQTALLVSCCVCFALCVISGRLSWALGRFKDPRAVPN